MIVLVSSLINAQSGAIGGALLILVLGPAFAVIASVTWPIWFPFTFILDVREDLLKKNGK
jgi:hypothetical protein